jgi:hypothetical protein
MKIEKIDNEIYLDGKKIKNNYLPTNETNLYAITKFIVKEICRYFLVDIGVESVNGEDPSLNVVISEEKNSYTVRIAKIEVQKGNKKHFLNFDKNSSIEEVKKSIQDFKIAIMGEL